MSRFSIRAVAWKSLLFYWRSQFAVMAGVAAATAVIVGALVVGDSVRGSLRGLVASRLGNIQGLLLARNYLQLDSLPILSAESSGRKLIPAIFVPSASVESGESGGLRRATQVQVLGVAVEFWQSAGPLPSNDAASLAEDEVVLNQQLANELGVQTGDLITLRIENRSGVPADNPLGRRDEAPHSLPRQKVIAVLPDDTVAGVNLKAGQSAPKNAFVSLHSLQELLETQDGVNAILATSEHPLSPAAGRAWCEELSDRLRPPLEDYGLQLNHHRRVYPDSSLRESSAETVEPTAIFDYYQLSSNQLLVDDLTVDSVHHALKPRSARILAYLANALHKLDASGQPLETEVPYSIAAGVEGPLLQQLEQLTSFSVPDSETPVWLTSWLSQQLSARPGDKLRLSFFAPETTDGQEVEIARDVRVAGVVPLTEPASPYGRRNQVAKFSEKPTIFNDPNLTPSVPGITDQESISNWDLPFTTKRTIRDEDDAYWNNHRLTPKLYLRYDDAAADGMFGSRFGHATSVRIEPQQTDTPEELRDVIEDALLATRTQAGLVFQPLRAAQMQAASGTTPFDMLFLSLSFFVIVAALMLVSLLFRLAVQQRARQTGLLLSIGYSGPRVRGLLLVENLAVAVLGAVAGVLGGLAYARLMIAGLESWWLGAISVSFLRFQFTPQSLVIGAVVGGVTSLLTIYWTLRKLSRQLPLPLLRGLNPDAPGDRRFAGKLSAAIVAIGVISAVALSLAAWGQVGMARAGLFFGCAMCLLTAMLVASYRWLVRRGAARGKNPFGLWTLARLAISRNPIRSVLSISLLAVASFMIVSMGVFQISPSRQGYGGFDLMAESSQPLYADIGAVDAQRETLGQQADRLAGTTLVAFKARLGEDASCNNLFQVSQPTVLAVPERLGTIQASQDPGERFQWSASVDGQSPWAALQSQGTGSEAQPIPVVLDQNTAAWSLHQGASLGGKVQLDFGGGPVFFRTVGLLSNSVLQGKLMISEANFKRLFPDISGYQFFMIRSGKQAAASVQETLETGWSDEGLDVTSSEDVLRRMLNVQNTYISAFQTLGALGLLLGTFGLGAAQVRSVLERERELALMRAVGFQSSRIASMLIAETTLLLCGGAGIGILAALFAIVPYIIEQGPQTSLVQPLVMMTLVVVIGMLVASRAISTANRLPILGGLRSE